MSTETPRIYKGVNIWPADRNSSGIRWTATVGGERLRADTLAGIKELVSDRLDTWGYYRPNGGAR